MPTMFIVDSDDRATYFWSLPFSFILAHLLTSFACPILQRNAASVPNRSHHRPSSSGQPSPLEAIDEDEDITRLPSTR
jgi:hypothetical protein